MLFYVEGYSEAHGIAEVENKTYPHMSLVTDNFDDFGNETLFRLYYEASNINMQYIGKVKILHETSSVTRHVIPMQFEELSPEFCSLGQSIDYYSRLREFNKPQYEQGLEILMALNDIVISPTIAENFKDMNGITLSLQRDSEAYHAYLVGHNIFFGNSNEPDKEIAFTFKYDIESNKEIQFQFNDHSGLPNRINVIVGKNGTGKTRVLSTLASVLSGYSRNSNCCVDKRPGFSRYIAISYSVFDDFEKPFKMKYTKKQVIKEKELIIQNINRLGRICKERAGNKDSQEFNSLSMYFKEIAGYIDEFEKKEKFEGFFTEILKRGNTDEDYSEEGYEDKVGSYIYCGLRKNDRIISTDEIYENFLKNLKYLELRRRIEIWNNVISEILDDDSIVLSIFKENKISSTNVNEERFKSLSSGQKIMIYIFTEVVNSITEDSLLLIDEPEIHLHPNAISSFMRMLTRLLRKFNSYAIISTHSPIVIQEVPSKYVRVFDNIDIFGCELYGECFGDNISKIISNVFAVRADESNYKTFFKQLKEEGYSRSQIENMFEDELSINANLYLNMLFQGENTYEENNRT